MDMGGITESGALDSSPDKYSDSATLWYMDIFCLTNGRESNLWPEFDEHSAFTEPSSRVGCNRVHRINTNIGTKYLPIRSAELDDIDGIQCNNPKLWTYNIQWRHKRIHIIEPNEGLLALYDDTG